MADARTTILNKLRTQARGDETHPEPWQSRRNFPNLAARFTESLVKVAGEAIRAGSREAALDELGTLLADMDAQSVVVNDEPPLNDLDLPARWPDRTWHIVGRSPGDLRAFCAAADVGLSGADVALAETGSIVVSSGPGRSRLSTLLPPVHVALVPTSALVTDITTWLATRELPFPANVNIISGPSKTADIEQTLAIGVHGPKRFIVILYDD